METEIIIVVSVFGAALAVLLLAGLVLCIQVAGLRRRIDQMAAGGRLRVQKLKMDKDRNHAFHNPTISPDEELSRRGYSMYMGSEPDLEAGRDTERQTGGQFVEELSREIDSRQQRQSTAPPFLLTAIEENKRKSRQSFSNPVAKGRQSDTNPNFIYS